MCPLCSACLRSGSRCASMLHASSQSGQVSEILQPAVRACQAAEPLRLRGFATNSTDVFNVHYDTPENNLDTTFDFTQKNYERANAIIANYPPNYKASAVIPLLDLAQQQNGGWLSLAAMQRVAKVLGMADIRVYEVGTFYSMFNRTKVGKYLFQICGTTPCRLNGSQDIAETLESHLGIQIGQTTSDGLFTLTEMECMGCCVNAPMIAVADFSRGVDGYSYNYYEDLTKEDVVKIADTYKSGKVPDQVGSQHRKTCEPAGYAAEGKWNAFDGLQTLTETPPGPYCRDLNPPAAAAEAKQ